MFRWFDVPTLDIAARRSIFGGPGSGCAMVLSFAAVDKNVYFCSTCTMGGFGLDRPAAFGALLLYHPISRRRGIEMSLVGA